MAHFNAAGETKHSVPEQSLSASSANLDFLRAFAVMCVFAAHFYEYLVRAGHVADGPTRIVLSALGHLGVLFFFVHTALVLLLSLERSAPAGLILNFYIRRLFRIYPLSIFCVAVVLMAKIPQLPGEIYRHWNAAEIVTNFLLVQDLFHKEDVIGPLWTLPREFQMYLVLPFLYLALKRLQKAKSIPAVALPLLLWVGFAALVPAVPLLSCFPCFMGGVMAYQLSQEPVSKKRGGRLPAPAWLAAVLAVVLLHLMLVLTIWPDYRADFVSCMLLGFAIPNFIDLAKGNAGWRWLVRGSQVVAKYSYGIYLCHDPAIWLAFEKLGKLPVPVKVAALGCLMAAIPFAAHHFLEAPFIAVGRSLANRWSAAYAQTRERKLDAVEA